MWCWRRWICKTLGLLLMQARAARRRSGRLPQRPRSGLGAGAGTRSPLPAPAARLGFGVGSWDPTRSSCCSSPAPILALPRCGYPREGILPRVIVKAVPDSSEISVSVLFFCSLTPCFYIPFGGCPRSLQLQAFPTRIFLRALGVPQEPRGATEAFGEVGILRSLAPWHSAPCSIPAPSPRHTFCSWTSLNFWHVGSDFL